MVSIISIWEISQELPEPYQSAVTKVIKCKDAVGAFFIHPLAFEWYLATSSIRPVWSLLFFGFLFSPFFFKKTLLESTIKTKRLREKGTCNTVLWNFIPIFADCDGPKRVKGKPAWFFVCVDLWTLLNVAASKSQSWTKETSYVKRL